VKNKTLVACLVVVVSLFSGAVFSAEKSHRQAAILLLDSMNMDSLLRDSINSMLQLEMEANPSLRPFEATMLQFFERHMSAESLQEEFIDLYVETFTESEMKEITAFYETPTGKKTLEMAPALMSKGAQIGQQRVMDNIGELQKMIATEAARIRDLQQQAE